MNIAIKFNDLAITENMVYREMGYKKNIPDSLTIEITRGLLEEASHRVKARCFYTIYDGEVLSEKTQIKIKDTVFNTGKTISRLMYPALKFVVFSATAGIEFQQWIEEVVEEKDALKQFILDCIGSTIAECAGDYMEKMLEEDIKTIKHSNRFSPGYCGWHVSAQQELFSLMPDNECGITLNDSSLMYPIKSISGIIGIGDDVNTKVYGCAICEMVTCYNRKKNINN